MKTCPSAPLVCTKPVAAESWFRIELVQPLLAIGIPLENIDFNYAYPDRKKADLAVLTPDSSVVIELKCFVCKADANKIAEFPKQLLRLEAVVEGRRAMQSLTFCTFCDYGDRRVSTLCTQFFGAKWDTWGPRTLLEGSPLKFSLASIMPKPPLSPR